MAIEKTIILNAETEDAVKEVKKVDDAIKDTTESTEKLSSELNTTGNDSKKNFGKVEKSAKKGAVGVNTVSAAFKRLGTILKTVAVTSVVAVFTAFASVASKNQVSIDVFTTSMTAVQILFNDIISGGERFKKSTGIFDYFKGIKEEAQGATRLLKEASLAQAELTQKTVESELAAEKERQTRDDLTETFRDRIEASERLLEIIKEQNDTTVDFAKISLNAAQTQFNLNNTIENSIAVIQAQTAVYEAENKAITALSEQRVSHVSLIRDEATQTVESSSIRSEAFLESIAIENELIKFEQNKIQARIELNNLRIEQEQDFLDTINEITGISVEERERLITESENRLLQLRVDNTLEQIELTEIRIQLQDDIVSASKNTLGSLSTIAGQETALGKALLVTKQVAAAAEIAIGISKLQFKATETIAEAAMDGAKATTSVATGAAVTLSAGFPAAIPLLIGYAAAAVGIVASIVQATKTSKQVAAKFGGTGPSIETPQVPTAPQFNIVGTAPENQLANVIQGQQQQPIKTFVVANEQSTAEALERNIIQTASFGN